MEILQLALCFEIILLGSDCISSFHRSGISAMPHLHDPEWSALLAIALYAAAVFAVELMDNKIQTGRWQHPYQIQTLILTRNFISPQSVKRTPGCRINQHVGIRPRASSTPVTPTLDSCKASIVSQRRASTPASGAVAELIASFEHATMSSGATARSSLWTVSTQEESTTPQHLHEADSPLMTESMSPSPIASTLPSEHVQTESEPIDGSPADTSSQPSSSSAMLDKNNREDVRLGALDTSVEKAGFGGRRC